MVAMLICPRRFYKNNTYRRGISRAWCYILHIWRGYSFKRITRDISRDSIFFHISFYVCSQVETFLAYILNEEENLRRTGS